MFYIDVIADGGHVIEPVRVETEGTAEIVFSAMEAEAVTMTDSEDCDMEFSVRLYDDNDSIISETVYADGKRIA